MNEYSFERVSENNVADLLFIYKDAFAKELNLEIFQTETKYKSFRR
jgi:hypothetical protein